MSDQKPRAPLRLTGIIFAFALNLLFVTLADMLVARWQLATSFELFATMIGPLIAGVATALYTGQRGGMHAFIGGMLSIPVIAYFVFPGLWQLAVFAGAFCGLGGAITEKLSPLFKRGDRESP